MDHLDRGALDSAAPLLRYRTGTPLTTRRYDHLWHRVGQHLPWVAAHGVTTHWLRHTTITWVERHYGYGIARAYAATPALEPDPPLPTSVASPPRSPPRSPANLTPSPIHPVPDDLLIGHSVVI